MTNRVKFKYSCSIMIPQFEACTKLQPQTTKNIFRQQLSMNEGVPTVKNLAQQGCDYISRVYLSTQYLSIAYSRLY